jgi:hypothetical protein
MNDRQEQLILFLAGELEPEEARELEAALERDRELREELEALRGVLELTRARAPEEPAAEYWRGFWARLQPRLERNGWWRRLVNTLVPRHGIPVLATAGALAAALIVAVLVLQQLIVPGEPETTFETTTVTIKRTEGYFEQAAKNHLESSLLLLKDVVNISPEDKDSEAMLEYSRALGERLLSQNRTYRMAAERNKSQRLAELLDDLELVLMDIANIDMKVAEEALRSLQRRIEKKHLMSKIEDLNANGESAKADSRGTEVI